MKCLCCGKTIKENASEAEKIDQWHNSCVRKFFGTETLPKIEVSEQQLEQLANETVNKGLTVPGVQKKMSLHLSKEKEARLTIVNYPTGYILKPQTKEYEFLPEYEDLAMRLAQIAGIQVVPHALMKIGKDFAYITKRIDREFDGDKVIQYAMEDFCQLSNRLTYDKYRGSYEGCGRIIKKYSIYPGLDMSELFLRVVFSYVIGNSDMHLKNFSLKEMEPAGRVYALSKAYDILPVNVILPEDEDEMALTLNGKKRNIRKKDFKVFAEKCEIPEKSAEKMMKKICSLKEKYLSQCEEAYLPQEKIENLKALIEQRVEMLL